MRPFITMLLLVFSLLPSNPALAFFSSDPAKLSDVKLCHKAIHAGSTGQNWFGASSDWGLYSSNFTHKSFFYKNKNKKYVLEAERRGLTVSHCVIYTHKKNCFDDCLGALASSLGLPSTSFDEKIIFEKLICPNIADPLWNLGHASKMEHLRIVEFAAELSVRCEGRVADRLNQLNHMLKDAPLTNRYRSFYSDAYGQKETYDISWVENMADKLKIELRGSNEMQEQADTTKNVVNNDKTNTNRDSTVLLRQRPAMSPHAGGWKSKMRSYIRQ